MTPPKFWSKPLSHNDELKCKFFKIKNVLINYLLVCLINLIVVVCVILFFFIYVQILLYFFEIYV